MSRNVRFQGDGKRRTPRYGRKRSTRPDKTYQRHRTNSSGINLRWVWAIVAIIAAGVYAAHTYQAGDRPAPTVAVQQTDTLRATFPICGDGRRVTCVVDGDTFWLSGERIRITDIDAPEINPPRCEAERVRGEAAKRRVRELLNAGPFSLVAGARDVDQYGRKLRTVMRDGRSIGDTLITEGLARRWDGARRSWCD